MRAAKVFEKFSEKGDPIGDMGISKINIMDLHKEIIEPAYTRWYEILKGLEGKTITGFMEQVGRGNFDIDATLGGWAGSNKFTVNAVSVDYHNNGVTGIVTVTDESGMRYTLDSTEDYVIK